MIFFKTKQDKGIELLNNGRYDDAIKVFSDLVSKNPQNPSLLYYLAEGYYKKNFLIEAKENLIECIRQSPSQEIINNITKITNFKKISSDRYYNSCLNFSSDGKKIIYVSRRRDTNGDGYINYLDNGCVYVVGIEGKDEKLIVEDKYHNSDCSFSSDGKYALYLSRRRDTNGDGKINAKDSAAIYIYDLEKNDERLLVSEKLFCRKPTFSPDNKSVIFCSWRRIGGNSGIYSINIKTNVISEVVSDKFENTAPAISNDGQYILYSSWRKDTNGDGKIDFRDASSIYLTDIMDRTTEEITRDMYDNSFPSFSPDDRYAMYLSKRRDTNNDGKVDSLDFNGIYITDLMSKKTEEIVSDNSYNKYPIFTEDGDSVVFLGSTRRNKNIRNIELKDVYQNKAIYIINIKNKKIETLVNNIFFSSSSPRVSKTGKLAYLSWKKHTRRGIFVRDIYKLPGLSELEEIIKENL